MVNLEILNVKKSIALAVLLLLIFVFVNVNVCAQRYEVDMGSAFFKAKISFNSYTGTTDQLTGFIDLESNTIEFSIPTSTLKTRNKKRDKHMYELIKVEEYTTVTFKGVLIDHYNYEIKHKQTLKVKGDFTLAGVSKDIALSIDLIPEQEGLQLNAVWSLLISDYGLERPKKTFFTVDDKHEISINAYLVKK